MFVLKSFYLNWRWECFRAPVNQTLAKIPLKQNKICLTFSFPQCWSVNACNYQNLKKRNCLGVDVCGIGERFIRCSNVHSEVLLIETDVPLICTCENWFILSLPFNVSNYSAELLDDTGRWHPLRSPVKILQIMNTWAGSNLLFY